MRRRLHQFVLVTMSARRHTIPDSGERNDGDHVGRSRGTDGRSNPVKYQRELGLGSGLGHPFWKGSSGVLGY